MTDANGTYSIEVDTLDEPNPLAPGARMTIRDGTREWVMTVDHVESLDGNRVRAWVRDIRAQRLARPLLQPALSGHVLLQDSLLGLLTFGLGDLPAVVGAVYLVHGPAHPHRVGGGLLSLVLNELA